MAVYLAEFEALSVRCRDTRGGLAAFMADLRVQQLGWPEDVVEQWLYDHAGVWSFQNDYGHIDLQTLAWSDELLASNDFGTMSSGASDGDLLEDNAANYEHWLRVRQYTDIPAYWDEHGTWKRRPLLMDRSLVAPGGAGLQVIEGRTRVGILRGLLAADRSVAPEHAVWVARPR